MSELAPFHNDVVQQFSHRGLAGTVLVYKIAGALARRGANLDEVYDIAATVAKNLGTVGVGLDHCHVCSSSSCSP